MSQLLNPRIVYVGFHHATMGWKGPPNPRELRLYDFWFVESGRGKVLVDGRWLEFQKSDLLIMRPGQVLDREETAPSSSYDVYFVHVHPFGERNPKLDRQLASILPDRLSFRSRARVGAAFGELFELYTLQPCGYLLQVKACMLQIVGMALSGAPGADGPERPPSFPRVQAAREYIAEHYRERLGLQKIAEVAGLSPSYLSALFRHCFGSSPIEYQIDVRLQHSKLLLARGRSVSAAAEEVGFSSIHYFSRLFKKRHGVSPLEFTRMFRRWPAAQDT